MAIASRSTVTSRAYVYLYSHVIFVLAVSVVVACDLCFRFLCIEGSNSNTLNEEVLDSSALLSASKSSFPFAVRISSSAGGVAKKVGPIPSKMFRFKREGKQ